MLRRAPRRSGFCPHPLLLLALALPLVLFPEQAHAADGDRAIYLGVTSTRGRESKAWTRQLLKTMESVESLRLLTEKAISKKVRKHKRKLSKARDNARVRDALLAATGAVIIVWGEIGKATSKKKKKKGKGKGGSLALTVLVHVSGDETAAPLTVSAAGGSLGRKARRKITDLITDALTRAKGEGPESDAVAAADAPDPVTDASTDTGTGTVDDTTSSGDREPGAPETAAVARHPDDGPGPGTAAVIRLDAAGDIPRAMTERFATSLSAGLSAAGFSVVAPSRVASATKGAEPCSGGPCAVALSERVRARYLLMAEVTRDGETYVSTLRLIDGSDGTVSASVTDTCEVCGTARVAEQLTVAASSLKARLEVDRAAEAELAAYKAARERELAEAAREEAARLEAARAGRGGPESGPVMSTRRPFPWGAVVLLSGGALAAGGGIWLLALHGRGTCSPGDPVFPDDPKGVIAFPNPADPDEYRCRFHYYTLPHGLTALGVGGAALLGGAVWMIVGTRPRKVPVTTSVTLLPGGIAGTVGVRW